VLENLLVSAKKQKGVKIMNVLKQNWIEEEKELHQSAFGILDFLNILHIWNNKASDISGGQQKLVSLGRSLMMQSNLILLDEPVAGVNPTLAKKVFMKIEQLQMKEGHNFVIIEHNMDVQLNFCDYLFVFDKGQVVAEGTPNEIRNNQDVLDAYLGN
jgi:branched-chain amino acid transport system ATP-binding protein